MADEARRVTDLSAIKLALLARQARTELDAAGVAGAEPIAVVGVGCRFPGADDPDAFWRLVVSRGDAIREVPADRWSVDALYDPDPTAPGKMTTRWGGFLGAIDGFDPQFFGISPREAARMDPQQRLLLEVAWEALEDAGQTRAGLDGSPTGVFVASYHNDYARLLTADRREIDAWTSTGTAHSIVANRLSYLLNLRGPSLTVDTACSASLVAVHLACRSLRAEECALAVAGGVSLMLSPEVTISLSKWGFMAADGRCKTFDAKADGFVRGEGCGVVVLKRLSDALADGDRILGLIRGSAVNQDGRTTVLTAPSGVAQAAVIRQALESGKVAADQVDYVETHGTGTVLGDPIEIEALAEVYGAPVRDGQPCVLGAVKANIGHLEAAAGIAGLIKALLCLRHGLIPPQCHFSRLNPHVSLDGSRLVIATEAIPWPRGARRRLAGVSSFGFGGTNAHVVLEEAPEIPTRSAPAAAGYLLPISAASEEALAALADSYRGRLEADPAPALADICYTAGVRRTHHGHRLAVVGATAADLARQLAALPEKDGREASERSPQLAFVFSGQGTQRPGMGIELLDQRPDFRATLEECDAAIRRAAGWSVIDELRADPARTRLPRTEIAQPAIFALQVAVARLWEAWGIRPAAICGHSVGEIAAAHVAGALTLEAAARIAVERGRIMERVTGHGRMLAVNLPPTDVESLLSDELGVAAINGPASVVLSGSPRAVEDAGRRLAGRGVRCHVLPVDYAFHSAQLEPLQDELARALAGLAPGRTRATLYSTVTGRVVEGPELTGRYWATGIRAPVLFAPAIDAITAERETMFVEIGPHPALGAPILECLAARGARGAVWPSLRRDRPELMTMLTSLGAVYRSDVDVRWEGVYPEGGRCIDLPAYPWQRRRHWHVPATGDASTSSTSEPAIHPLVHRRIASPVATLYEARLRAESPSYLAHHRIHGAAVLPATAYIEMALVVGETPVVEDLVIVSPLTIPDDEERLIQIVVTSAPSGRTMQVFDAEPGPEPRWTLHATARLGASAAGASAPETAWPVEPAGAEIDLAAHHTRLGSGGIEFGPAFLGLTRLSGSGGRGQGRVTAPAEIASDLRSHQFHPALMDACLQVIGAAAPERLDASLYLPMGVDRVVVHRAPSATLSSEARVRPGGVDVLVADVRIRDEVGVLVAELEGIRLKRVDETMGHSSLQDALYEVEWRPQSRATAGSAAGAGDRWLILGDRGGLGVALAARLEAAGDQVTLIGPGAPLPRLGNPARVVYLGGLGATVATAASDGLVAAARTAGEGFLQAVQALAADPARPRLWVVTANAQAVTAEDRVDGLPQASLWGLGRVVALEHPELRCVRIDIEDAAPSSACLDGLVAELRSLDEENEVALRGAERLVARLVASARRPGPDAETAGAASELTIAERGTFDRLAWRPVARRRPGPGEIEIEVTASGLNFRDVLNALGAYPGDPGPLGSECAGRVVAVGPDASVFAVGDAVAAVSPDGGFRSFVTVAESLAARVPSSVSLEDAAAAPIAFLTALHGLETLAQMRRGDRVLIHAAAGGVGLAAVQLAQRAGAEVFATVGSERKRRLLASLGITQIMSSRSVDFAREIMERTGGRGVDVVLNSLAGEFIPASLSVLAPGGRFVELGKTGIWDAEQVRRQRADVSYWAMYFGDLCRREPGRVGAMLARVLEDLDAGRLRRLPRRTFARAAAAAAFRFMAQARHVGKIVLADGAGADAPAALRPDGIYLVTGGLGALGIEVARWMASRGARHLALLGRHGAATERARDVVSALREQGTRVDVVTADVTDGAAMRRVLHDLTGGAPLRGVVHAAGALDDGVLGEQSWDRMATALRAKAEGAWILHELTRDMDLDFFVLFSSAAGILGSAGQGGYAAANASLDALAQHRRALDLPATSIAWGRWAVGMAASVDERDRRRWSRQGITEIELEAGLEMLGRLLDAPRPQMMVAPINWAVFCRESGAIRPLLADLGRGRGKAASEASTAGSASASLTRRLEGAAPSGRRRLLVAHVQEEAAKVLALDGPRTIGVGQGLRDLGLDSLMAVELRNRLQSSVGRPLPSTLVFDHPTVESIADFIAAELGLAAGADADAEREPGVARAAVAVAAMSEEEAEASLLQELAALDERKGKRR